MKQRYIARYGNAYELPSPNEKKLMSLLRDLCTESNILCTPDACFAYVNDFPENYEQMRLF